MDLSVHDHIKIFKSMLISNSVCHLYVYFLFLLLSFLWPILSAKKLPKRNGSNFKNVVKTMIGFVYFCPVYEHLILHDISNQRKQPVVPVMQ